VRALLAIRRSRRRRRSGAGGCPVRQTCSADGLAWPAAEETGTPGPCRTMPAGLAALTVPPAAGPDRPPVWVGRYGEAASVGGCDAASVGGCAEATSVGGWVDATSVGGCGGGNGDPTEEPSTVSSPVPSGRPELGTSGCPGRSASEEPDPAPPEEGAISAGTYAGTRQYPAAAGLQPPLPSAPHQHRSYRNWHPAGLHVSKRDLQPAHIQDPAQGWSPSHSDVNPPFRGIGSLYERFANGDPRRPAGQCAIRVLTGWPPAGSPETARARGTSINGTNAMKYHNPDPSKVPQSPDKYSLPPAGEHPLLARAGHARSRPGTVSTPRKPI